MTRSLWVLAAGLLIASPAAGDEPRPTRLRLVIAHGAKAQRWLACIGKDLVQVEPLIPRGSALDEWSAAETQLSRLTLPDAFVTSNCPDDLLGQFWCDRLRNQGPIEVVALETARSAGRVEEESRLIRHVHGLLVKLCPEAKAILDQRMFAELLRLQPVTTGNEPVAQASSAFRTDPFGAPQPLDQ